MDKIIKKKRTVFALISMGYSLLKIARIMKMPIKEVNRIAKEYYKAEARRERANK